MGRKIKDLTELSEKREERGGQLQIVDCRFQNAEGLKIKEESNCRLQISKCRVIKEN